MESLRGQANNGRKPVNEGQNCQYVLSSDHHGILNKIPVSYEAHEILPIQLHFSVYPTIKS